MDGTFGLVCQSKWSSVMCDYHSLAKQYLLEWSLKLSCSENNSRVVERHNQWNTSMEDQSFACCSTKSTWRHNHHATITVMSSHPLVWPNHLYKSYPVIFVLYTLVLRSSVEGGPSSRLQVEVCGEECGRPAFRMCIMNSLPNAHAHLLVVIMSVIVLEPDPSSWSGSKTIYTYAHFCVWICACAGCFPHDVKVILPMFTLPYICRKTTAQLRAFDIDFKAKINEARQTLRKVCCTWANLCLGIVGTEYWPMQMAMEFWFVWRFYLERNEQKAGISTQLYISTLAFTPLP